MGYSFKEDLETRPETQMEGSHGKKSDKMGIDIEALPALPVELDGSDEKANSMHGHFEEVIHVKQGLHQRHIQMIALAGTIGTGLFLSSGRAVVRSDDFPLKMTCDPSNRLTKTRHMQVLWEHGWATASSV